MRRLPKKWLKWIVFIAISFFGAAAAWTLWTARQARLVSTAEVVSERTIAVRSIALDTTAPSWAEPIAAPADYADAALFLDRLYVLGAGALFVYTLDGVLEATWRCGLELPSAPLRALAVGSGGGQSRPELFVATAGQGLLAFDGRTFRQILPESAPARKLTTVLPFSTGRVLVGTEKAGVLVWDGATLRPLHEKIGSTHVTALAGSEGDVWIGTLSDGLLRLRGGDIENLKDALPDPHVLALTAHEGRVYAGTPAGVAEFENDRRARVIGEGYFARALWAGNGRLLIGTQDQGVVEAPLTGKSRGFPVASGPNDVRRFVASTGGPVAVAGDGVYVRGGGSGWTQAFTPPRTVLADSNIAALARDSDGSLWVGYFDRGLDIFDAAFERRARVEDDRVFCINRIVFSPGRDAVAVATANGLVLLSRSGQQRQALTRRDGLIADHVTDVAFTDRAMIAATPAGITFIEPGNVRSLYVFHGLVNNHAYALAAAQDRTLVGTLGGMSMLEGDVVRASYTTSTSALPHNWITAIVPVGDEWFAGTYGAGVVRVDRGGGWRRFADLPAEWEVNPNAMAVSDDYVYAGSLTGGLYIYDRSSGRWSSTSRGLPSMNVTALTVGGGYVYAGTDNGIVRLREGMPQ